MGFIVIKYSRLGTDKRLRDIVFAGSHDAGITGGTGNVQTQSGGMFYQAQSGVRIFDLRIRAHHTGYGKSKLKAYHAQQFVSRSVTHKMSGLGEKRAIRTSKIVPGTGDWGSGLPRMLREARAFVSGTGSDEFLILKFDKCNNWDVIAETCISLLGDKIYTTDDGPAELSRATLGQLAGRVVICFSEKGMRETLYDGGDGIFGIRNLYSKGEEPSYYDPTFEGLQYFGKGGTSVSKAVQYDTRIDLNIKNQSSILSRMANTVVPHSSNVLGMMYWTTTGVFESIRKRDRYMWSKRGQRMMRDLWEGGLKESIDARISADRINPVNYSSGPRLRAFIPNIVMIDFASHERCVEIYKLNTIVANQLTQIYQDYANFEDANDEI